MPCEHLELMPASVDPDPPGSCGSCLEEGTTWVHLRMCLQCGRVGCCDSSVGRHATAHFRTTTHPVMQSAEPRESWRWCYVDQRIV